MTESSVPEGLVGEFLTESLESLEQVDRDFVALEEDPTDRERLARVFRAIHTIKGSCGFLEFPELEALAHSAENLLGLLRDGTLTLDQPITSALLATADAIRDALARIGAGGSEGDASHAALIAQLDALRGGGGATPAEPAPEPRLQETPDFAAYRGALDAVDRALAGQADAPQLSDALARLGRAAGQVGLEELAALLERASRAAGATRDADLALDLAVAAGEALATYDATREVLGPDLEELESRLPPDEPSPAPTPATSGGDDAFRRASAGENTIRVDVQLLDRLMNLVGELVLSRNQILQHLLGRSDKALAQMSQRLSQITTDLQENIMLTRLQPIEVVWGRFPRMVRDLSLELGKQVQLVMEGGDTELDRTLLEAIRGPLTHLVRNAIDHGIETAEERSAQGKDSTGKLSLRAWHEGGQVNIEIADDGRGIDGEHVLERAVQKGLVSPERARSLSEQEKLAIIFLPGFSTAHRVTNVSGRGVGMDVVKSNIEGINGVIEVESRPGNGTAIRLKIPLTLAIVPALMVACGGERYAIPQTNLLAVVRLTAEEAAKGIERLHNARVYRWRGRMLPLLDLAAQLRLGDEATSRQAEVVTIVVLQASDRVFGLVVDRVLDSGEIVVKPLGRALRRVRVYAGATITGDGRAAMILDVLGLAQSAAVLSPRSGRTPPPAPSDLPEEAAPRAPTTVLLARIGSERVAVPLSDEIRLERFPRSHVEGPAHRPVVRYRGGVLPLRRLEAGREFALEESEILHAVVYTKGQRSAALLVDELLDILSTPLDVQPPTAQGLGLVGAAVIRDQVAHVLDLGRIAVGEVRS